MKENNFFKTPVWKNIRLALVFLVVIGGLWATLDQLDQRNLLIRQAQLVSSPPQKVRLTNVYSQGFTVTWFTTGKTTGKVIYSDNKEMLEKKETLSPSFDEERGKEKLTYGHSVKLSNLTPGKKYYFKIVSGGKTYFKSVSESWQEAGVAESIELPSLNDFNAEANPSAGNSPGAFSQETNAFTLARFRPNPIYGQVKREDGSMAQESIVFLEIPGRSNLLSTVTDNQGKWVIEMGNLRENNLSRPLSYLPGVELLKISAKERPDNEAISYQAIPAVTTALNEKTNPVTLVLLTLPAPLVNPTNTPQPSPTRPPQPSGAFNFTTKLQGATTGGHSINTSLYFAQNGRTSFSGKIKMIPQETGLYSGRYSFYKTGAFDLLIKPDGYLKKNLGVVSLGRGEITKDFSGQLILAGDLNHDNEVNCLDVSIIVGQINTPPKTTLADFDNDGTVSTKDLAILTTNYLKKGD